MPAVELDNRAQIAAHFRRNAAAHVYELGDLDDFEWPHTRWFGWESHGFLKHVALLYTQPEVPVLIAIADPPVATMEKLLTEILPALPPALYVHATPSLIDTLAERFMVVDSSPHVKLALGSTGLLERHAVAVDALTTLDLPEIDRFYPTAYPGTWFDPRMLGTDRYVGIRQNGQLSCIAGVHVYSPTWGVAALGNVATLPERRGQGLARGACAALCLLLRADGIETIALNVRADNGAAIQSYTRLGFEPVAEYTEASLVAR